MKATIGTAAAATMAGVLFCGGAAAGAVDDDEAAASLAVMAEAGAGSDVMVGMAGKGEPRKVAERVLEGGVKS